MKKPTKRELEYKLEQLQEEVLSLKETIEWRERDLVRMAKDNFTKFKRIQITLATNEVGSKADLVSFFAAQCATDMSSKLSGYKDWNYPGARD